MRTLRIVGIALLGVLALTAALASTASAAPKTLELYNNGTPLSSPAFVALISTGDDITFSGPNGTFACTGGLAGVYGSNQNNGEKKDLIELSNGFEDLNGGGGQEDCVENVTAGGFPWVLTLGTKGKASVAGKMTLKFVDGCEYTAKKLAATQTFGYLYVDISGTFKVAKADKNVCEKTVALNTGSLRGTGNFYESEFLEDYIQ